MATEASLPHHTADVQVEEKNVTDEIKIADEKSDFEPKEIEGKLDEGNTVAEELANSRGPITETENKEADRTDAVVEEMKIEEEDKPSDADVSAGDALDNPLQCSDTGDVSEPVAEGVEREPNTKQDDLGTPEPPTEALKAPAEEAPGADPEATNGTAVSESLTEESKNEPAVLESATQVATSEPAVLVESLIEEATNEPAVSEPVTEESLKERPVSETVIEEATNEQSVAETLAEVTTEPTSSEPAIEKTINETEVAGTVTEETLNEPAISETVTEEAKSVDEPAEMATPPVPVAETEEKQERPEMTGGAEELKSVEEPAEIATPPVPVAETEEKQEHPEVTGGAEALKSVEEPAEMATPPVPVPETEEKQKQPEVTCGTEELKSVKEPAEIATPPVSVAETEEKQEPPEVTSGTEEVKSVEEPAEIATPLVSIEVKQEPLEVTGGTEPALDTNENLDTSKLVEVPQEEKAIDSNTTVEEAVPPISPAAVVIEDAGATELKETGAEAVLSEVADALKDVSDGHGGKNLEEEKAKEESEVVLAATEPAKEEVTEILKPEAEEEEGKEDKAAEVEEPPPSEAVKTVPSTEVAAASTEGENASVEVETVEKKTEESLQEGATTSRDFLVKAEPGLKAGEPAGDEQEETQKAEDKNVDASAKDEGDTKAEVQAPPKPSQRQSNNIIARMKQSIVKVKKAITGKSSSSKTMSTEGKDEIKVK